ncbi:hypothetical protein [Phenylobacterium kunshanense]|uniref:Uncharacterized protein n=1 Tax=Phenylobacterium kunshanense TaxID=1445034 RepID=A0A328BFT1_9CAUL|nr:hypothetical protein [Phenylobacterium kunshanense]RAK65535.1 hypothetical protein DJ019_11270 [Phenylobacterium kunshanense]
MLDALDITEAETAGLSELAALDLSMARLFAARAEAAEDPQVQNEFARSYQRMARSYRQTLALKIKLKRDLAQARRDQARAQESDRDSGPSPDTYDAARVEVRKQQVRQAIERVAWDEYEPYDKIDAFIELERYMDEEAREPGFVAHPLPLVVARLCLALNVDPPPLETEPPQPSLPPAEADWRGSG